MKVLHVVKTIAREYGGPARSVQGLVAALNGLGVQASLLSLKHGTMPWVAGVVDFYNGDRFEDVLIKVRPNIVHIHEIWDLGLHRCVVICRRWRIPYIIAPRGTLEPWSLRQKWLKKRIARLLYQDRDLRGAVALHATAESEAKQLKILGFANPVVISPNGVNVPNFDVMVKRVSPGKQHEDRNVINAKRALFVSRMHPKKGVLELVEAWGRVDPQARKDWLCELVYTVNGDSEREYEAKVKARVDELCLKDQFIFTGALSDNEKWNAYCRADLFVLPTYSENFGIVIAEALWAGIPVITTKGAPWQDIEFRQCGWWVDVGVEHLSLALYDAMNKKIENLEEMGRRGRLLIEEKYGWPYAAQTMSNMYEEICRR